MIPTTEIAVIGGGPAGSSAALHLASAGRDVLLLEREDGVRDKVCGEFLSGEALAALESCGIAVHALGAASIEEVRVSAGARAAATDLPFRAAGLSRAVLDRALLGGAERRGAQVLCGARVRAVERTEPGFLVRLTGDRAIRARAVVLATGKQDLAPFSRTTRWTGRDGMIGLKMHCSLDPAARARLGRAVELYLFPGGCAGLQPIGSAANLCLTLNRGIFSRSRHDFGRLLAAIVDHNARFADALRGLEPLWPRPLAVARVPYGFRDRAESGEAVWRVGDQVAVTASFTGDGLAIALQSGIAAAEAIIAGSNPAAYARSFGRRARRQLAPAMLLQGLVDRPALHGPAVALANAAPWTVRLIARRTRLPLDDRRSSAT